eukprot:sb/3477701/
MLLVYHPVHWLILHPEREREREIVTLTREREREREKRDRERERERERERLYLGLLSGTDQEPTDTSKQPIRTRYLGHVTGYQPIGDQYFLIPAYLNHNNSLIRSRD